MRYIFALCFFFICLTNCTFHTSQKQENIELKINDGAVGRILNLKTQSFRGTGFVVNKNNMIVTAYHVIENQNEIYYEPCGSNKRILLTVDQIRPEQDIAILKPAEIITTNPFQIGSFGSIKLRSVITYIGFDDSLKNFQGKKSRVFLKGDIFFDNYENYSRQIIRFVGNTSPGYSGGPVLNEDGNIVAFIYGSLIEELKSGKRQKVVTALSLDNLK